MLLHELPDQPGFQGDYWENHQDGKKLMTSKRHVENGPIMSYHGGGVCGIKHIWNLSPYPTREVKPYNVPKPKGISLYRPNKTSPKPSPVDVGLLYTYQTPVISGKFPKQTCVERVSSFIETYRKTYPKGALIQICLNSYLFTWVPYLEQMGFKESEKFRNSSSGGTVSIWNLLTENFQPYDQEKVEEIKAEKKSSKTSPTTPFG